MMERAANLVALYLLTRFQVISTLVAITIRKWSKDCICKDTVLTFLTKLITWVLVTLVISSILQRTLERNLTLNLMDAILIRASLYSRAWWTLWDQAVCLWITFWRSVKLTMSMRPRDQINPTLMGLKSLKLSNLDHLRPSKPKEVCQPSFSDTSSPQLEFNILWAYNPFLLSWYVSAQSLEVFMQ